MCNKRWAFNFWYICLLSGSPEGMVLIFFLSHEAIYTKRDKPCVERTLQKVKRFEEHLGKIQIDDSGSKTGKIVGCWL